MGLGIRHQGSAIRVRIKSWGNETAKVRDACVGPSPFKNLAAATASARIRNGAKRDFSLTRAWLRAYYRETPGALLLRMLVVRPKT